jgi:hypothetical protein
MQASTLVSESQAGYPVVLECQGRGMTMLPIVVCSSMMRGLWEGSPAGAPPLIAVGVTTTKGVLQWISVHGPLTQKDPADIRPTSGGYPVVSPDVRCRRSQRMSGVGVVRRISVGGPLGQLYPADIRRTSGGHPADIFTCKFGGRLPTV